MLFANHAAHDSDLMVTTAPSSWMMFRDVGMSSKPQTLGEAVREFRRTFMTEQDQSRTQLGALYRGFPKVP